MDGNPLEDIKVLQNLNAVELVIKEGVVEVDPDGLSREEKMTVLMRLNKGVTGKMEVAGKHLSHRFY